MNSYGDLIHKFYLYTQNLVKTLKISNNNKSEGGIWNIKFHIETHQFHLRIYLSSSFNSYLRFRTFFLKFHT